MEKPIKVLLLFATIASLNLLNAVGQDTPVKTAKNMHHEEADDPYLPNAYQDKKVSPAYRYKNTRELKVTSTSIFTAQVNVDGDGQNILGDAANETNIAVNPLNPDEIVIGWRQFDNVTSNFRQAGWSYTTDGGQNWTFPGVLEPGIFRSDPVLDYDAEGVFYYNSLMGNFACKVFKSSNGGAVWDEGADAGGGDKQWMTIDRTSGEGSGNIYSSWTEGYTTCPPGFFTRSTDGGSGFEECTEVAGSPFWGTMAVGNNGELYIAGGGQDGNLIMAKSNNAQNAGSVITWLPPVSIFMDGTIGFGGTVNPAGLLGQVSTDVDRSAGAGKDNVYVLASLSRPAIGDPGDVMFTRSLDEGIEWDQPKKINDDEEDNTQWFGTMSVAPNGRIDAVWLDTRNASLDSSALYYSFSNDEGITWSVNEKLSDYFDPHVGYPNQDKMGDYFDMISDNTGTHLAWANTFNGEQDVYYSRIIPDVVSGINPVSNSLAFSVFPNPGDGIFEIKSEINPALIEVHNLMGEKVYAATHLNNKNEIDISALPAGIYFLKLWNDEGIIGTTKIIRR